MNIPVTAQDQKPPIKYHGRAIAFVLLVLTLPTTVVTYLFEPRLSVWTFAPGIGAAVLVLGAIYFKWWREGRLR